MAARAPDDAALDALGGLREPDHVADLRLEVAARDRGDRYEAWVYLGTNVIHAEDRPSGDFPEGLADFAGWTAKQFSRRLAALLAPPAP